MSRRRVAGLVALVTVLVLGGAATVMEIKFVEFGEGLRGFFDEGLLRPYESRQLVAVADEGFTIRISEGWVVLPVVPSGPAAEPSALRTVLGIDPRHGDASCSIQMADGAGPGGASEGDLHDAAETWLEPWMGEHGFTEGCGGTVGDSWGDKVGLACEGQEALRGAAWVVPHASDLVMTTCTWSATTDESNPFWRDAHLTMMALEPLADSIDFRSDATASARVVGSGGRAEAIQPGVSMTFPDGWVVVEPGAPDYETALASVRVRDTVADLRASILAGARPAGVAALPLEWCAVKAIGPVFPWTRWPQDSSIKSIATLLLGGVDDRPTPQYVGIPAGLAARLDDGPDRSVYLLINTESEEPDTRIYGIECAGMERPTDRWLSIAETFEFLPAA